MRLHSFFIAITFAISPAAGNGQLLCDTNFDSPQIDPNSLRHAVFSIGFGASGTFKSNGTGYLVDSTGQIILTAKHVLDGRKVGQTVAARSDSRRGEKYNLEIVALHPKKDIAILKILEGELPNNTLAFDLRMKAPKTKEPLHTWSHQSVAGDTSRKPGSPEFSTTVRSGKFIGSYQFVNTTLKQASGSPVFDDFGRVVATVTDNTGFENYAFAVPSGQFSELAARHVVLSEAANELEKVLKNRDKTIAQLVPLLYAGPDNATNLELLVILAKVFANSSVYPDFERFLLCPIFTALIDRGLRLPPDTSVQILETAAKRTFIDATILERAGDTVRASNFYEFSYVAGAQGADKLATQSRQWISRIACTKGLQDSTTNFQLPPTLASMQIALHENATTQCDLDIPGSNRLGRLLADSARAKFNVGRLDQINRRSNSQNVADAQTAAALAILVSDREEVHADASAVIGRIFLSLGNTENGRRALAAAYLNGERQNWIVTMIERPGMDLAQYHAEDVSAEVALDVLRYEET